jgi:hypothetical protein
MRLTTTGPVQTARSMRHNVGHCSDSSSSTHAVTNDSAAAVSAAITSSGSSSPTTVANIMQLRRAICLTSTRADCHALSEPEPSPTTVSTDTYRKRPGTHANGNRRTASLRYHPDVATAEKSSSRVAAAEDLFRDAFAWLGADYGRRVFYVERDLVYTLQSHLVQRVESEHLPYRIYNDYPMIAGLRRSLSAELSHRLFKQRSARCRRVQIRAMPPTPGSLTEQAAGDGMGRDQEGHHKSRGIRQVEQNESGICGVRR